MGRGYPSITKPLFGKAVSERIWIKPNPTQTILKLPIFMLSGDMSIDRGIGGEYNKGVR